MWVFRCVFVCLCVRKDLGVSQWRDWWTVNLRLLDKKSGPPPLHAHQVRESQERRWSDVYGDRPIAMSLICFIVHVLYMRCVWRKLVSGVYDHCKFLARTTILYSQSVTTNCCSFYLVLFDGWMGGVDMNFVSYQTNVLARSVWLPLSTVIRIRNMRFDARSIVLWWWWRRSSAFKSRMEKTNEWSVYRWVPLMHAAVHYPQLNVRKYRV